ncbi:ABATE domain-containing protein [Bradyrhizobium sp. CB3481]|uniref:CGNR zinc finger domain-containing protein n=1 Tax=Bradyrhizobium sp. CB3481 TaxID=3039158 RepID=UPI0024B243AE|nr:ABATE domain-containing protein [Bradyrhizobium sp. CB3481]WFU18194.1 ABATE domain-containing protein [Bradyrhizobium sp. CB3481]
MNRRADHFDWSGGHPALDFVNTLDERPSDEPIDNLATYRDLARFAELAGLIEPQIAGPLQRLHDPASIRIVKRARHLREHLHDLLAATTSRRLVRQADLDALSAAIQAAHAARALVASRSTGLVEYRWRLPWTPVIPLHACALAIESLLVGGKRKRIRKCGAADCDVYYLDTSKAQRRQWCSMKGCGNREKQRRRRSVTRN